MTILITNLNPSVTQDMLLLLFTVHGTVDGVDIVQGQDFGYVRMKADRDARNAMAAVDGMVCCGVSLIVREARALRRETVR